MEKSLVMAHTFFNLASFNGNSDARKMRDSIAKTMTRKEIEKAQALAEKMLKEYADKRGGQ